MKQVIVHHFSEVKAAASHIPSTVKSREKLIHGCLVLICYPDARCQHHSILCAVKTKTEVQQSNDPIKNTHIYYLRFKVQFSLGLQSLT